MSAVNDHGLDDPIVIYEPVGLAEVVDMVQVIGDVHKVASLFRNI